MGAPQIDLELVQGDDATFVFRWSTETIVWKPIQSITKGAPCVVGCTGHGLVDAWPFWIAGAGGMRQINIVLPDDPPYFATVQDANTVQIADLSSWEFTAYTTGGSLGYYAPRSLAGASARAQLRSSPQAADPALLSLVSPTNIVLDDTAKTIAMTIANASSTSLTPGAPYWYDLEITEASGEVTTIAQGRIAVSPDTTR